MHAQPARAFSPMLEWAARDGQRIALIEGTRRISYAMLARASEEAAALLAARGVRPGDRVLIVAENGIAAVVLLVAAQRLEAWPAMANARLPWPEIEQLRAAADARLAVFATGNSAAAAAHAEAAAAEPVEHEALGRIAFGLFEANAKPEAVQAEGEQQVGLLLFTSGTTGKPKAVMISHHAMLNAGASMVRSRGLRGDDVFYGGSPVSHVLGGSAVLSAVFCAGAAIKLVARMDLAELGASISSGQITYLMAVPMVYAKLIEHAGSGELDLSKHRLRCLMTGGAPLDPTLARRVAELFGLPLGNGYAMTECAPIMRTPADGAAPEGSVGMPEGGSEVRLVADGCDVPAGEVGEIWVRSPSLMMGYYRDPAATAAAMRADGWFATGDLGRRLENGHYAVVGRSKEMIIRSGFNVYPAEVEAALLRQPGIAQCAVVGRPGAYGDEEVCAFVQLRPGEALTPQDIVTGVAGRLAPYKRPGRVIIVPELPLSATGKVSKRQLAEMAAALD